MRILSKGQVKGFEEAKRYRASYQPQRGKACFTKGERCWNVVLWESPLGNTVGGAQSDLSKDVEVVMHQSKTHFDWSVRTAAVKYRGIITDKMYGESFVQGEYVASVKFTAATKPEFLEWWKWEIIGAACEPKYGGCRCGNCQPVGKEMTLAEEKELEIIRRLTYVQEDTHIKSPHQDARYRWTEDPTSLPNNKSAVEATFLKIERQLEK